MQVYITDHARQRLSERVGVSKRKMNSLVYKAWKSTNVLSKKYHRSMYKSDIYEGEERIYRELMGYVFIFVEHAGHPVLITVL